VNYGYLDEKGQGVAVTLKDEIGKRGPFDSPEQEAYLNLLRTFTVLEEPIGRLLKSRGLSEATYNTLRILRGEQRAGNDGVSCNVIGERLISRVPDVTRLVDRLERKGLAKRSRAKEDRRVVRISITARGLDLLEKLDRPLMDAHKRQLEHMSREELVELNRLLVKARRPD
jgi:DNA-binding MarR family transcriptional regulator